MTSRRDFLRRGAIALAGGLIVGDAALEAFERLTHVRKTFPSASWKAGNGRHGGRFTAVEIWERLDSGLYSHRTEITPSDNKRWGSVIYDFDGPLPFALTTQNGAMPDSVRKSAWHTAFLFSAFGKTA